MTEIRSQHPEGRVRDKCYSTAWCCRSFAEDRAGPQIDASSITHVRNAEEEEKSVFRRRGVFCFKDACSWIDVALKMLQLLGWSPERSEGLSQNVGQVLPPACAEGRLYIGSCAKGSEEGTRVEEKFVNGDSKLSAHATVSIIDKLE